MLLKALKAILKGTIEAYKGGSVSGYPDPMWMLKPNSSGGLYGLTEGPFQFLAMLRGTLDFGL